MEATIQGLGFRGFRDISPPVKENQIEKQMDNYMKTGVIGFIGTVGCQNTVLPISYGT